MKRPPPIELRQLHAFRVVAGELHFGRAARRLGIAQPPLSQQIKRLEAALGYPLFERNTRKVSLTPSGIELFEVANALLAQLAAGLDRVSGVATGEAGRLAVGFTSTTALRILPAIVRTFRAEHMAVHIEMFELLPDQMRDALITDQIDVALMREPLSMPDVELTPLFVEPFVAVLPKGHEMADPSVPFDLRRLSGDPFVLSPRDRASEVLSKIFLLCEQADFRPKSVLEVPGWQTAISMVGSGMGVSILPESVTMLHLPGIVYRTIESTIGFNVCLLRRKEDMRPVVRKFIGCGLAVMGQ